MGLWSHLVPGLYALHRNRRTDKQFGIFSYSLFKGTPYYTMCCDPDSICPLMWLYANLSFILHLIFMLFTLFSNKLGSSQLWVPSSSIGHQSFHALWQKGSPVEVASVGYWRVWESRFFFPSLFITILSILKMSFV